MTDLASVHQALLAALPRRREEHLGVDVALPERVLVAMARTVLEALRPIPSPHALSRIVLVASVGSDELDLEAVALAQRVMERDFHVVPVPHGDEQDLCTLAEHPDVLAVVLSASRQMSSGLLRRLAASLRAAAPEALLIGAGRGFPTTAGHYLDLLTCEAEVILDALERHTNPMTEREQEILQLVAEGKTNPEIAELLSISSTTIRSHVDRILAKTEAVHRSAAVAQALRCGWIA